MSRPRSENDAEVERPSGPGSGWIWFAAGVLHVLFILIPLGMQWLSGGAEPGLSDLGAHTFLFLDSRERLIAFGVCLLAALLVVGKAPFPGRWWQLVLLAAALGAVFTTLKDTTHLLGDGRLWISVLTGAERSFHAHEPLSFALYDWLVPVGDAAFVVARAQWVGIGLGVVAVFLVGMLALRLAATHTGRWFAFLTVLGSGTVQFGFGYIEAYPVLWVAILAYLLAGVTAMRGGSLLPASLALGLTVAVHGTGVLLGPSWLVLAARAKRRDILGGLVLGAIPVLGAYLVAPQLAGSGAGGESVEGTRQILEQFRVYPHGIGNWLVEQADRWALAAPLAVPLLLLLAARRFRDLPALGATRGVFAFLGTTAFGLMLFPLVVDTNGSRGWLVDWDNFSTAGPALMACVALAGASQIESGALPRRTAARLMPVVLFATVCFVLVNANPESAALRFSRIQAVQERANPSAAAMGAEALAMFERDRGNWEAAGEAFARAARLDPGNPRRIRNAAATRMRLGQTGEAARLYEELTRLEPANPEAWFRLGTAREANGQADAAAEAYRRSLDVAPTHVGALDALGGLLVRTGRREADRMEAVVLLRRLLTVRPDHPQGEAIRRTIQSLQEGGPE